MRNLVPNFSNKDISRWTAKKKVHTSLPFGKCVPLAFLDILPGDNIGTKIKGLIRMLTPKTQIMDSIYFDIYPYFVPRTQVDLSTKQFYGENENDAWTLHLDHKFPRLNFKIAKSGYGVSSGGAPHTLLAVWVKNVGGVNFTDVGYSNTASGTLLDHFGLPFVYINDTLYNNLEDVDGSGYYTDLPMLYLREEPFRVYQKIWNDEFRNPAVVDPSLAWSYTGSDTTFSSGTQVKQAFRLLPAMKSKDLFTSCVISPQRGSPVEISLLETAPVVGAESMHLTGEILFGTTATSKIPAGSALGIGSSQSLAYGSEDFSSGNTVNATNLVADLHEASSVTVDNMRFAIATQHFQEWMTRSFRFKDFMRIFFGTNPKSLENDRPLRIGGLHGTIITNQVVQSGGTASGTTPLGSIGGYSATALQGYLGTLRAEVPGTLMFIIVFRKAHAYCQGLDKYWTKETLFDTYLSPFKNIGYVALKKNEIYWQPGNSDVLGYTEYGYEYRYLKDEAHGLMNPLHPQSLSYSTLTDVFDSAPTLDTAFVSEDSSGLDNALIASASVTDQFYATFHFEFDMVRRMNLYSVPGLDTI